MPIAVIKAVTCLGMGQNLVTKPECSCKFKSNYIANTVQIDKVSSTHQALLHCCLKLAEILQMQLPPVFSLHGGVIVAVESACQFCHIDIA